MQRFPRRLVDQAHPIVTVDSRTPPPGVLGTFPGIGRRTKAASPEGPPLITVVVPTHNRRRLLEQTMASVFNQSLRAWELIVVDDASEDGTWEWLQQIADPRVRIIRLPARAEQSATRNTGVKAARAGIVLSVDDDDLLPDDALAVHVGALREHPEAIASVGGHLDFDERGSQVVCRIVRRRRVRMVWQDVLFGWIATSGETAFRAHALASVGWWNESYQRATDHELWSRIARLGPVVLLPEVVLHYRVHAGQWRPENLDAVMTRARAEAVAQLQGAERDRGEEILRLRELSSQAFRHFLRAEAGKGLRLYLQVVRKDPSLLRSPLTRPLLWTPIWRSLGGSFGIRIGRRVLDALHRLQKRDVDFSVRTTVASDERGRPLEP